MNIENRHKYTDFNGLLSQWVVAPIEMSDLQYPAVRRCQDRGIITRVLSAFRVPEKKEDEKGNSPCEYREGKKTETGKEDGQSTADNDKGDTFFCYQPFVVNA